MEINEGLKTEMETRKEELKEEGRMIGQEARQAAQSFMKDASNWTATALHDISDVIRTSARELESRHYTRSAPAIRAAADRIDRAGDAIQRGDLQSAITRTKQFARERPEVFVGVTALAGFALGRFLRSSTRGFEHRRQMRQERREERRDMRQERREERREQRFEGQQPFTSGGPTSQSFPGQPTGGTYPGA